MENNGNKIAFKINGMTCNHCKANATKAISNLKSVKEVIVNLSEGVAYVDGNPTDEEVKSAVEAIGFEFKGHAGFSQSGQDIICSAVSALVINTVNSIEKFTNDDMDVFENEEEGHISLKIKSPVSHDSELLMNSLLLGINQIAGIDDEEFLKVEIKEV